MTRTYIEPEDIIKMEQFVNNLRDLLLIRVIFWLGCRVTEALGVKVSDIDFENGLITIKHLKVRVARSCPSCGDRLAKEAKFCPGCGKEVTEARERALSNHRQRQVPVHAQTLGLLRQYIDRDRTKGLLFKIGRTQAYHIIRNAAEKAGLGELINPTTGKIHHVSPHKLRDAFATMAVKLDDSMDSIRALQEQLGHASIGTTMKYRKIAGKEHKKWYDKMTREPAKQLNFME